MSSFPLPDPPSTVAYAVTAASRIFNGLWETAQEKSVKFDARLDDTTANVPASMALAPAPVISGFTTPTLPTPPTSMNASDLEALYNNNVSALEELLVSSYSDYLATYFPAGTYLSQAQSWIENVLSTGGTGVNPTVEAQLWERDRARVLQEAARMEEELLTTWAGRRFPLPPGALTYQVLQVRKDSSDKIAESSRNTAIKVYEIQVEQARFAVQQALALRQQAVQAAGEYMRNLALAPQIGATLAAALADAQARLASVTTEYYKALIAAQEIPLRVATTNAELAVRVEELRGRLDVDLIDKRVQAAIGAAQMYSTQAAAAFNALHSQAAISSSDSVSTSL